MKAERWTGMEVTAVLPERGNEERQVNDELKAPPKKSFEEV